MVAELKQIIDNEIKCLLSQCEEDEQVSLWEVKDCLFDNEGVLTDSEQDDYIKDVLQKYYR
jgi:hypothetical protein